jgi:hypothetical protein
MMRVDRSPIVAHADHFKARDCIPNCFQLTESSRGSRVVPVTGRVAEDLDGQISRENEILSPHLAATRR